LTDCGRLPQTAADCGRLPPESESESESNTERESARARTRAKRFTPPTPEEVETYCKETGISIDAEKFCAYYASKDWMVGKVKMTDWKASVISWSKNEFRSKGKSSAEHTSFDTDEAFAKALRKTYGG